MGLKHSYQSAKSDPVDTSLVGATKWNDDHYFIDASSVAIGALGDLPYRGTAGLVTLLSGAQGILTSAGSGNVPAWSMTPVLTSVSVANTGLKALDTNASHYLKFVPGSDITADRSFTVTTGDADRTLTISGNPTLADWFDQAVKAASSPTFAAPTVTSITIGAASIDGTDAAKIDGITNGTTAASKALVTDANGAMSILRTASLRIGASGSEVTVTATGGEINALAGVTAGTIAASKVVVVDSNKDASSFRNLGMTGTLTAGSGLTIGTSPAATGLVRLPKDEYIKARNSTNTADISLIAGDGDRVYIGGGNFQINLDPGSNDIVWGKALVSLGGGSAPTLGTIGGSGPATAGQNSWLRIKDSSGAVCWVPVWK